MTDELLDIIDVHNNVVGQELKSIIHAKGLPHRVSAILVQKENGKYLIPTASNIKVEAGGLFHSAAGHVTTSHTYQESAARELWEETGLKADEYEFELFGSFWLKKSYPTRIENERFEVFKIKYRPDMGQIKFNDEQNNEQWFSEDELKNIFLTQRDKLSYPLILSCQNIFKFN